MKQKKIRRCPVCGSKRISEIKRFKFRCNSCGYTNKQINLDEIKNGRRN